MKRVIAIFLTILYFAFLSGSLWSDFHPDVIGKSFYADSADAKDSQKSADDEEINTTKHIVQGRHLAPVVKIKISRTNVSSSVKDNMLSASCHRFIPSDFVNTSPYCNTSLIIRNCVFRI